MSLQIRLLSPRDRCWIFCACSYFATEIALNFHAKTPAFFTRGRQFKQGDPRLRGDDRGKARLFSGLQFQGLSGGVADDVDSAPETGGLESGLEIRQRRAGI